MIHVQRVRSCSFKLVRDTIHLDQTKGCKSKVATLTYRDHQAPVYSLEYGIGKACQAAYLVTEPAEGHFVC